MTHKDKLRSPSTKVPKGKWDAIFNKSNLKPVSKEQEKVAEELIKLTETNIIEDIKE